MIKFILTGFLILALIIFFFDRKIRRLIKKDQEQREEYERLDRQKHEEHFRENLN